MGPLEVLKDITSKLESKNIDYLLVGSLASMYYGQPRFTNDVDLVVQIHSSQTHMFLELFKIEEYYCPPDEILRDEILRSGSFNLIHQKSMIKIDIDIAKPTDFYKSELSRKLRVTISAGLQVNIASAEDIIIKKLDYYRMGGSEKHLTDIRGILSETKVDQAYLDFWIQKFGLSEQWSQI